MNKLAITRNRIYQYRQLQEKFVALCTELDKTFLPGNEYGIEIETETETETETKVVISKNILILDHPCRLAFGLQIDSERVLGKITFQRLLPRDQTDNFLTVYFDTLGNARESLDDTSWAYSLIGTDITNWLAIIVLEEFFKSLTASKE